MAFHCRRVRQRAPVLPPAPQNHSAVLNKRTNLWLFAVAMAAVTASAQEVRRLILPEQRDIVVRSPTQLRPAPLPDVPPPVTVAVSQRPRIDWQLSLDEAIRLSLANSEVIRVLAGTSAVASGSTVYDPAIANTQIDQNRAVFDPTVESRNTFFRSEVPQGVFTDPLAPPSPVQIRANPTTGFRSSTGVQKQFITGGTARVDVNVDQSRVPGALLPLNPQTGTGTSLSLNQPLLQGAGAGVNLAPILISRIDTERSFFQLKDSVQDLVRGTIEAYWQLSFSQVDVFAREQQVAQGREALGRAEARLVTGSGNEAERAQARVSYETFRANLIAAEANRLNREAALRNIMGVPPSDERRIVPVTPPSVQRITTDWEEVLGLAEQYRPDLVELKLILEADQQQLIVARNNTLPRLDGVALYRWNGLEGRTPEGTRISDNGQFTDWELGVNFSVPLFLRRERAQLRQTELLIMRDRANLDQGLHAAAHTLATRYRNLDQYYEQYLSFSRVRAAARSNVENQLAIFRAGRREALLLNVLQAITDWGNAVSNENQALVLYNTELANLQRETGLILESYGVRFWEERFRSIGPLGRHFPSVCYPRAMSPGPNVDRPPTPPEAAYRLPEPVPLPDVGNEEVPPPPPEPFGTP
jgi:outer membrane protein TolC